MLNFGIRFIFQSLFDWSAMLLKRCFALKAAEAGDISTSNFTCIVWPGTLKAMADLTIASPCGRVPSMPANV